MFFSSLVGQLVLRHVYAMQNEQKLNESLFIMYSIEMILLIYFLTKSETREIEYTAAVAYLKVRRLLKFQYSTHFQVPK